MDTIRENTFIDIKKSPIEIPIPPTMCRLDDRKREDRVSQISIDAILLAKAKRAKAIFDNVEKIEQKEKLNPDTRAIIHEIKNKVSVPMFYLDSVKLGIDITKGENKNTNKIDASCTQVMQLYSKLEQKIRNVSSSDESNDTFEEVHIFKSDYTTENIYHDLAHICNSTKVKNLSIDYQNNIKAIVSTKLSEDNFETIMNNLIKNAAEAFNKENSKLSCFISDLKYAVKNSPYVYIRVADNGGGIKQDDMDKIFDIGFSKKEKQEREDRGVGLWHVKKLVEGAGGKIYVNSREGQGTSFNILIPIVE